jgi:Mrp family chromosome partitioning ATPase
MTAPETHAVGSRQKLSKKQRQALSELQRAWQRLAVNILASNSGKVPWVMGIGSAVRGEGRTTAALGISHAIARETGSQVALLELDLENPSISHDFQSGATPGLINYLSDECSLEDTFRAGADGKIVLIPASSGWSQTQVSPTLDDLAVRLRHRMPEIVQSLKAMFKYTVVDLPPVLSNMQTERIATSLNGTLMVVRSGVTPVNLVQESVDLMGADNLLGVIQVGTPSPVPSWLSNLVSG